MAWVMNADYTLTCLAARLQALHILLREARDLGAEEDTYVLSFMYAVLASWYYCSHAWNADVRQHRLAGAYSGASRHCGWT